jgi:hypothetical protein
MTPFAGRPRAEDCWEPQGLQEGPLCCELLFRSGGPALTDIAGSAQAAFVQ